MAVPKSRRTKSSRDRRRAHIYLSEKGLLKCANCGAKKLPHRVCKKCGYYKGEPVLEVEKKKKKKEERETGESALGGGPLDFRKLSQSR